jgi:hypothetical protein
MESNAYSMRESSGLDRLTAVVEELAAEDLSGLSDGVAAARVLALRRLLDRLEGQWLRELAAVDGRGAAGADRGVQAASTAGWLRGRLRAGHPRPAGGCGPRGRCSADRWRALAAGELSPRHAAVLAAGTADLSATTAAAAEPVLLDMAGRLDPPGLRKLVAHLRDVADPDGEKARIQRQHERRGLWLSPTLAGMVAVDGLLEPEAGETLLTALEPLARPASAELHGGPTDLGNLVLLCRAHHRAVHEGGQRLHPPHRRPTAA